MGELEYNFDQMAKKIRSEKSSDITELFQMINEVNSDDFLKNKKVEASETILASQVKFLKQRIQMELESREKADEDI